MTTRIALAQIDPTVGDIEGNRLAIERWIERAREAGADLVAFPELAVTGYPPEDLVLRASFVEDNIAALHKIARSADGIVAIVGFIDSGPGKPYNAAAIAAGGKVRGIYHKHLLPNYGVFDEERYFERGHDILLDKVNGTLFGVTICEDVWEPDGPHAACAAAGAGLVININGSPYHHNKGRQRLELLQSRAQQNRVAIAYVNMTGGQDELVFDGQSLAVDSTGKLVARAAQFTEELLVFDFESAENSIAPEMDDDEEVYRALVLGVGDYLAKNGFTRAFVGLSGGIDSALTAAIAADALGPANVTGVLMPSRYTSNDSLDFAKRVASNLGIKMELISITGVHEAFAEALDPPPASSQPGIAEENVQPRIRGTLLMALSNRRPGSIVLSTGNKSELATGYATLYGDMAGGFAVLKDVPKTLVYRLARWRNQGGSGGVAALRGTDSERQGLRSPRDNLGGEVIPQEVIDRPPTAELRPGQLDTDSLPPYEKLDPILEAYVEGYRSVEEMIEAGFDAETVRQVVALVDRAEYKRRQAPPGIKITKRAFGRDWRLPITNRFRPFEE